MLAYGYKIHILLCEHTMFDIRVACMGCVYVVNGCGGGTSTLCHIKPRHDMSNVHNLERFNLYC